MREPREVQWARAVRLLGAAERVAQAPGHRLSVAMPEEYERTVEGARVALGEEAFTAAGLRDGRCHSTRPCASH